MTARDTVWIGTGHRVEDLSPDWACKEVACIRDVDYQEQLVSIEWISVPVDLRGKNSDPDEQNEPTKYHIAVLRRSVGTRERLRFVEWKENTLVQRAACSRITLSSRANRMLALLS